MPRNPVPLLTEAPLTTPQGISSPQKAHVQGWSRGGGGAAWPMISPQWAFRKHTSPPGCPGVPGAGTCLRMHTHTHACACTYSSTFAHATRCLCIPLRGQPYLLPAGGPHRARQPSACTHALVHTKLEGNIGACLAAAVMVPRPWCPRWAGAERCAHLHSDAMTSFRWSGQRIIADGPRMPPRRLF